MPPYALLTALSLGLAAMPAAALPPLSVPRGQPDVIRVTGELTEPEVVVRTIYGYYTRELYPDNPQENYFSPDLLALWNKVLEGAGEDFEYAVDFDVFINAQDTNDLVVRETNRTDLGRDRALVYVTFGMAGSADQTFAYTMLNTRAGWKIDDIDWGSPGASLRNLLNNLLHQQSQR